MHDPDTLICSLRLPWTQFVLFMLWHHDPCAGGSDDSCGWFKRAHHGDPAVLAKIRKEFEFEWDRTFDSSKDGDDDDEDGDPPLPKMVYQNGYFHSETGLPVLSEHAITLNLFQIAAINMMGWRRGKHYIRRHLADILLFAENPVDSLHDTFTLKFERGCGQAYTPQRRLERISRTASCIYGVILRDVTPWWQHPRWHVHHWRFQFPWWQQVCRVTWSRCKDCGSRFHWNESVVSHQWNSPGPRWGKPETWLTCEKCSRAACAAAKDSSTPV